MDRYDAYYAKDTDGVHFVVRVDGRYVQGYIGRALLAQRFAAVAAEPAQCVGVYLAHQDEIDAAVDRRVRDVGPETVILQREDLPPAPGSPALRQEDRGV